MKIKVGLIGFGRMGRFYLKEMQKSGRWEVAYICDINPDCRELAKQLSPESKILENEQEMFDDESVQVVGLFALADSRLDRIEKAIKYGKHIISEKPVSDTIDKEWKVVDITEKASFFLPSICISATPGIIRLSNSLSIRARSANLPFCESAT